MKDLTDLNDELQRNQHALPAPSVIQAMPDAVDVAPAIAINMLEKKLSDADAELTVKITGSFVAIRRLLE